MKERSDLMSLFLKHGIGSLSDMRHIYDSHKDYQPKGHTFKVGGQTERPEDDNWLVRARKNVTDWLGITNHYTEHRRNQAVADAVLKEYELENDPPGPAHRLPDGTVSYGEEPLVNEDGMITAAVVPALGTGETLLNMGRGIASGNPGYALASVVGEFAPGAGKALKTGARGVENILKYRKAVKGRGVLEEPVQSIFNRYRNTYSRLQRNLETPDSRDTFTLKVPQLNSISTLDAPVTIKRNYVRPIINTLLRRRSTAWTHPDGKLIEINPYNEFALAWADPEDALKRIKQTMAHEGTHVALRRLGDHLTRPGGGYWVANEAHPLFDSATYAFSDPERVLISRGKPASGFMKKWLRSPEEFIADLNKFRYQYESGFPQLDFRDWSPAVRDKAIKYFSDKYSFTPEDAEYIINKMSDFGYSSGGKLNKKSKRFA